MTEKEAVNELLDYAAECDKLTISLETVTLARKALEEIQEYRAIGTVEEFKALKEKKQTETNKAYDVEKVVEEIEKMKIDTDTVEGRQMPDIGSDIVRKGGVYD